MILQIDPAVPVVPIGLIEGLLRRTICMLFFLLRRAAEKIASGHGAHAQAVRADATYHGANFYTTFLQPRLQEHFKNQDDKQKIKVM